MENIQTPEGEKAAEYFREVLTNTLDPLLDQCEYQNYELKYEQVKESLRTISELYKIELSRTSANSRSNWNDEANRCAYVFTYFVHHCHLIHHSLQQNLSDISRSWRNKGELKVCSIGGGPGSDLVGLTRFLQDANLFPPSLQCLVLDKYPNWERTWETIYRHLPETFDVGYHKCDLVKTPAPRAKFKHFVGDADLIMFVKSFSAVAAFLRQDPSAGSCLRAILRELKAGSFVLYIDNKHWDDSFLQKFALPAGLEVVYTFCGKHSVPHGQFSHTINKYCHLLNYSPMRSCNVTVRLFHKKGSQKSNVVPRIDNTYAFPRLSVATSDQKPTGFTSSTSGQTWADVTSSYVPPRGDHRVQQARTPHRQTPASNTSLKYTHTTQPAPITPRNLENHQQEEISRLIQPASSSTSRENERTSVWDSIMRCMCCARNSNDID